MNENEIFRANLLQAMAERGLKAAELSRMAGLNPRAVKDIEERQAISPKLSTVFALARALGVEPGELMGLGPRQSLSRELVEYLSAYSQDDQQRLLLAISAIPPRKT